MQTVAGVGGSLLRARPSEVAKIEIPLPPLSEQKRIAGILDQASGLRRKRQQALALTDQFLRSTFLDLFGDPVTNPKRWPMISMRDGCKFVGGSSLPTDGDEFDNQTDRCLLLKVGDMNLPGNETFITTAREWAPSPRRQCR